MAAARCINLDWLEVYALEPVISPRNADYFREVGFHVKERDYGTRIYEQMFILIGSDNWPLLEIRRKPFNSSVLPLNACHVRLVNRSCYFNNAATIMQEFLCRYGFQFVSIYRVDICMDFEFFDSGDDPAKFVKRYIGHKYAKVNQSDAHAFFRDDWDGREFNSFSWGSKHSDIGTKLYNKTYELYDGKLGAFKKPYILQSWFAAGLVDDPVKCLKKGTDGKVYRPKIWRLEFSVRSDVKRWFVIGVNGDESKKRSIPNTLSTYANRSLLLPVFDILQQHYFHFKKFQHGKSKYQCPDKQLFKFNSNEVFYRVEHVASPSKPDALIIRLEKYLKEYLLTHQQKSVTAAAQTIIDALMSEEAARQLRNPFSKAELDVLRRVIALRFNGGSEDPCVMANELSRLISSHELF